MVYLFEIKIKATVNDKTLFCRVGERLLQDCEEVMENGF